MDTETVKLRPCDHAGVVVFDDEHIVFGESCSQVGRPGLAEGDTARVVGPRLHDGDGWTLVECGLDGVDNRAFGIDRDADHIGASEFEHVENRRKGRSLNDHSIAEVDGGIDQPVERILRSVEQGDSAGIVRPSAAEFDLERGQDGPVEIAGDLMVVGGLEQCAAEVGQQGRVGCAGREIDSECPRLDRHVPGASAGSAAVEPHGGAATAVGVDHAASTEAPPGVADGAGAHAEFGGKASYGREWSVGRERGLANMPSDRCCDLLGGSAFGDGGELGTARPGDVGHESLYRTNKAL